MVLPIYGYHFANMGGTGRELKINTATYLKYGSCLYLRFRSTNLRTNTTITQKKYKKVLPINCYHFANLEGTRGANFVFTDISTSYLTSVKPSNYSSRITNHPFGTLTITIGHVFMSSKIVDPQETHSFFNVLPPISMVSRFTALESWCGKFSQRMDSFDIYNLSGEFSPSSECLRSPSTLHIRP